MSKRLIKRLQQEEEAKKASRLKTLGWEEIENWKDPLYRWRCIECKTPKLYIDCGICFRCEGCYHPCKPDTDTGKAALRDYITKGKATCDFDIFGRKLL